MRTATRLAATALCLCALAATMATTQAARKQVEVKTYKGQTTHRFPNRETVAIWGLHVKLSNKAWVVTDPETGFAGPFRTIRGNNSDTVHLTNPEGPIPVWEEGGEGVTMTFRSMKKGVNIKSWWWTDQRGKRVGPRRAVLSD